VRITTDGAAEHIEKLAQKYLGKPYPWYGGRDQVRVLLVIEPDKINAMGRSAARRTGRTAENR
jgi:hypothetical protein